MELRLRLERFPPQAGLKPRTGRSVSQRFTYGSVGLWNILLFHFYNQYTNKYIQYTLRDYNRSQMLIELLSLTGFITHCGESSTQ